MEENKNSSNAEQNVNNQSPGAESGVRYYSVPGSKQLPADLAAKPSAAKPILIFAAIVVGIVLLGVACSAMFSGDSTNNKYDDVTGDYIGVLHVEGTISGDASSDLLSDGNVYNHQWTLDRIDEAIVNKNNKGLIIFVDSPGGGVYESDELYLKLKEYKEETGRPLYSAMGSMAASGGYYISAPADRIIANRNCWTGSIGVTIGTLYDISGLLDRYGIKTVTITSGKNKAMGSIVDPMSKQQKKIFQSLVDDAYHQFVGIVAKGRNMPVKKAKQLADGRIYTARQAVKNGLIDQIGTLEDAEKDMKQRHKLKGCKVVDMTYEPPISFLDRLLLGASQIKQGPNGDVAGLLELMSKQGKMPFCYMSEVYK